MFNSPIWSIKTNPPAILAYGFLWRTILIMLPFNYFLGGMPGPWIHTIISSLVICGVNLFFVKYGTEKHALLFYYKDDVLRYRFQKSREESKQSDYPKPQSLIINTYLLAKFCWSFLWRYLLLLNVALILYGIVVGFFITLFSIAMGYGQNPESLKSLYTNEVIMSIISTILSFITSYFVYRSILNNFFFEFCLKIARKNSV